MAEKDAAPIDVAELQATLERQNATWEAGPTFLTELPSKERKMYLGFEPPGDLTLEEIEQKGLEAAREHDSAAAAAIGYPSSFDWRNVGGQNYVTSVKQQGGCGSCVAFGTTATVEAMFRIQRGNPGMAVDLSEASLFYCVARSQGRTCANGWWPTDALTAYQDLGVPDEACFPYTAGDQACGRCSDWASRAVKITGWHSVGSVTDMKNWVSTRGPLSACFTVYSDFYAYKSGVYRHLSGDREGGHCVCIVGYDDTESCWICKNSWGSSWGDVGYFRIAYGECGIEGSVHAVDGILETTGPWKVSWGGTSKWEEINRSAVELGDLRFGDFTGDGKTDVFRANGTNWFISEGGTGKWRTINASAVRLPDLAFGDFTGDGKTDVFRANGTNWFISEGGTGKWRTINASAVRLPDLAFGDFTGDGKTDVFRANGTNWFISEGGTGKWRTINASAVRLPDLAFGDFTGDGKTDVFRANGTNWFISEGGTGKWRTINASAVRLPDLAFGDFTGDGKTDVFRANGTNWFISEGGTGKWRTINASAVRLPDLAFGDFNGDGKTDVFRAPGP